MKIEPSEGWTAPTLRPPGSLPDPDLPRRQAKAARLAASIKDPPRFGWRPDPEPVPPPPMARDLDRQIKRQELEVRRLELTGPWRVTAYDDRWAKCEHDDQGCKIVLGRCALLSAVAWAECQNRKAGAK